MRTLYLHFCSTLPLLFILKLLSSWLLPLPFHFWMVLLFNRYHHNLPYVSFSCLKLSSLKYTKYFVYFMVISLKNCFPDLYRIILSCFFHYIYIFHWSFCLFHTFFSNHNCYDRTWLTHRYFKNDISSACPSKCSSIMWVEIYLQCTIFSTLAACQKWFGSFEMAKFLVQITKILKIICETWKFHIFKSCPCAWNV